MKILAMVLAGGKTGIGARTSMPAAKLRIATTGSQPMVRKRASFRETAAKEHRQNIAGAPYYRGLHWDC
jgi:hypothetical protein